MLRKGYVVAVGVSVVALLIMIFVMRYYARVNALESHKLQITALAQRQAIALESELQKFTLLPNVLSETQYVHSALQLATPDVLDRLNKKLVSIVEMTGVDYIYVIDRKGKTVASSNSQESSSFIGSQFAFRPYFKEAMAKGEAVHFAKGELTGKAGLFLARRIEDNHQPIGVIVVKVEFGNITQRWQQESAITLVTNLDGIILFASDKSLDFSLLRPLDLVTRDEILRTKQFGLNPLLPAWMKFDENDQTQDQVGSAMQAGIWPISGLDWNIMRIEHIGPALKIAETRSLLQILSMSLLVASFGVYLSWKVTRDRERAMATEGLKGEVAKRTIELVETNDRLRTESEKRDEINARFRRAREELAQANRLGSIGVITASVAHEINQPVAAIKAFAQNAKKLMVRQDEQRVLGNLDAIVELTSKIGVITNELRRYARRDGHVIGKISLHGVIDGVELLMGERIRCAGVSCSIMHQAHQILDVKGERVRVEQVLVNLLQNAIEALENHPNPMIEVRFEVQDSSIVITVDDNGIGIDDSIKSEIFTPFMTNKPKGLGIGLGIARDIVAEFGGSLEIVNSRLGGAAFELRLVKI